ncbi:coiled-coil domain-containing protein [Hespellia stercorisuis]|uniref:N-terminal domain of peptidoglycan hydrolase CwlO-containing protein n=1 Tax=Hespellia stercorisuis DSM 15480 TaxID=1121950 RepID=A0A1M6LXV2_9FIRM|nr:hypothetical protein [Hespellia stercorisuis]SHJ76077.1 N-terminal domain of peptidoglycan hydrolase CwlO-containing protein [Hespellia stercorisuis DSM 15480]
MNIRSKRRLQINIGIFCSLALLSTSVPVLATDTGNLENQSSSLQQQLQGINGEILDMSTEIANIEIQVEDTNNAIISTQEQLSIIQNDEARQYQEMKSRIQYMYENGNTSLLEMLFSSKNISEFLNSADFIESISSYDREKLVELQTTCSTIEKQQDNLSEQKASLEAMQSELQTKQDSLNQKAAATSTDINAVNAQIAQIKTAQLQENQAKEAQARAAAQSNKTAQETASTQGAPAQETVSQQTPEEPAAPAPEVPSEEAPSDSSGNSDYTGSDDPLTPGKGVVYFNGHRETYYSENVLPGTGLNIPGRHVAADGTIRDADNYICVASSDYEKGTIVETSLGMGKVYDSGCASGTIDIYTNW